MDFNLLLRNSLGAGWGMNPSSGKVAPGPISVLSAYTGMSLANGGFEQWRAWTPAPTYQGLPGDFGGYGTFGGTQDGGLGTVYDGWTSFGVPSTFGWAF